MAGVHLDRYMSCLGSAAGLGRARVARYLHRRHDVPIYVAHSLLLLLLLLQSTSHLLACRAPAPARSSPQGRPEVDPTVLQRPPPSPGGRARNGVPGVLVSEVGLSPNCSYPPPEARNKIFTQGYDGEITMMPQQHHLNQYQHQHQHASS